MSEHQYYEFQAVDRPLTAAEMSELRACSTRARITPASFTNSYSFGDFKGNQNAWMDKYFGAFLYAANWGTHELQLRLPASLVGREQELWAQVESCIAIKQSKSYAQAVKILVDLRDLDARRKSGDFQQRIENLRRTHARKPSLIENLNKAGL